MEFSGTEYWSKWPFPSPGDLPNSGIEPRSPTLQADSLPAEPPGKSKNTGVGSLSLLQWIFLSWELNQGFLHCRQILYQLSYQGSPFSTEPCLNQKHYLMLLFGEADTDGSTRTLIWKINRKYAFLLEVVPAVQTIWDPTLYNSQLFLMDLYWIKCTVRRYTCVSDNLSSNL